MSIYAQEMEALRADAARWRFLKKRAYITPDEDGNALLTCVLFTWDEQGASDLVEETTDAGVVKGDRMVEVLDEAIRTWPEPETD